MSRAPGRHPAGGELSRREVLGALARWSVPTVLTLALASRPALAQLQISCPPCTKRTNGLCRACTMNQMLNCQCEPCLGAPYCANGVRAAAVQPRGTTPGGGFVTDRGPASGGDLVDPYLRLLQRPSAPSAGGNPFAAGLPTPSPFRSSPFSRSPFGARGSSGGSLFDRLRPDGRGPF